MADAAGGLRGASRDLSSTLAGNESIRGGENIEAGRLGMRRWRLPLKFGAQLQKGNDRPG